METFSEEIELVRRCQRTLPDDTRAFEALVLRYKKRVFATAYRLMGDYHDAEEQAQEVFLKIFRNIKRLDNPATVTAWIYRITTNTCLDALAKRDHYKSDSLSVNQFEDNSEAPQFADARAINPEGEFLTDELRRCIERTLAELDDDKRGFLVLRDVEDRSYQEIAELFDFNLSAVKMRIHRARVAFQQMLDRVCPNAWRTN